MSDMPTSLQYRLGVNIGHAIHAAIAAGMTHDEAITTLRHTILLTEVNRDLTTIAPRKNADRHVG